MGRANYSFNLYYLSSSLLYLFFSHLIRSCLDNISTALLNAFHHIREDASSHELDLYKGFRRDTTGDTWFWT